METPQSSIIHQTADLIRSGELEKAAPLLASFVQIEPDNAAAWLLLAGCAPDPQKQRFCLSQSLAMAPEDPATRQLADRLGKGEVLATRDFLDVLEPPVQAGQGPDFIVLACPNCGGPLQVSEEKEHYTCPYCGQEQLLRLRAGLEPVLENLKKMAQGINRAADELAIQRLGDEIDRIQQDVLANRRNFSRGGQFLMTGFFVLVVYFVILAYPHLLYLGAFLAAVGLCLLLFGARNSARLKAAIQSKQGEQIRVRAHVREPSKP